MSADKPVKCYSCSKVYHSANSSAACPFCGKKCLQEISEDQVVTEQEELAVNASVQSSKYSSDRNIINIFVLIIIGSIFLFFAYYSGNRIIINIVVFLFALVLSPHIIMLSFHYAKQEMLSYTGAANLAVAFVLITLLIAFPLYAILPENLRTMEHAIEIEAVVSSLVYTIGGIIYMHKSLILSYRVSTYLMLLKVLIGIISSVFVYGCFMIVALLIRIYGILE